VLLILVLISSTTAATRATAGIQSRSFGTCCRSLSLIDLPLNLSELRLKLREHRIDTKIHRTRTRRKRSWPRFDIVSIINPSWSIRRAEL
jgi:hypothetical protein